MVPLYPKFPFIKVSGTFVAIRLEDMLIAFSALLLFIVILPNLKNFLTDKLTHVSVLFLFVGFVSLLSSLFILRTVVPSIGFLHWARRVEYLIPLFLGIEAIKIDRKNLDFYIKILIIIVFLSFVYGLGQRYLSWPIIITQNQEYSKGVALRWTPGSHINSTFAGHYDLSTFLVLVLPILITAFFVVRGKFSKVFLLIAVFSGLWLLVNSAARISQVSYLGAVTLGLLMARRYKEIFLVLAISILFIGTSSSLLNRYMQIFNVTIKGIEERTMNINPVYAASDTGIPRVIITPTPSPVPRFEDRSTNIRLVVEWPRALRAFAKNPLLGTGYSSITLATDNDYLRLLGEVGFLGFLSFIILWVTVGIEFLKKFPFSKGFSDLEFSFITGLVGGTAGVFVNAVFIDVFEASKFILLFMLFIGMGISLVRNTYE